MFYKSFFLLTLSVCYPCLSHYHPSYHRQRSDWRESHKSIGRTMFSVLNDTFNVGKLFVIGTHNSMAYDSMIPLVQCQTMTLYDQLNFGIRFLDIRLRRTSDKFACHHSFVFLGSTFDDVLQDTLQFLRENPREAVFMGLQEDFESYNSNRTICDILSEYIREYGKNNFIMTRNNTQDLRLFEIRGKIVLIAQSKFNLCDNIMDSNICTKQNHYDLTSPWELYYKWVKAKDHIDDAMTSLQKSPCYMNFLSASSTNGLVYPDFVVSGHIFPYDTNSTRLPTGLTDLFYSAYPDFPRVDCIMGVCKIAFEGTNVLITDTRLYKNDKVNRDLLNINSLYIIMTDYFGPKIIEAAYELNRIRSQDEYEAIKRPYNSISMQI